ncbi:MAG: NUDIX domain-containing protein [Kiritimatiellae bacterium]|nr:NUDIX domain-containing protein [Kiritimatiellia bacterium]
MSKKKNVEIIARGVCVKEGKILLCFGRKSGIAYLPGGHIDFGESGQKALQREITEEMGLESEALAFIGCCEHAFMQEGEPHSEINLVYKLEIPSLDPSEEPQAVEDWIGFVWHPLDKINEVRFEPVELGGRIRQWLTVPGGHLVSGY